MKKIGLCLGALGLVQQVVLAQFAALYFNSLDGATVSLSSDVSVTNNAAVNLDYDVAGISFDRGLGSGVLEGAAQLSVHNIATQNEGGAPSVYGVYGTTLGMNNYTGRLVVTNDWGRHIAEESADASAAGVLGDVLGDLNSSIFVEATSGKSTSELYSADSDANAFAIEGELRGHMDGVIEVFAQAGDAVGFSRADADANATGIEEYISGSILGELEVVAIAGNAISEDGNAYANARAEGVNEDVSGRFGGYFGKELNGALFVVSEGGTSSAKERASANARSYAVVESFAGNFSGEIVAYAFGGAATSSLASASAYALAEGVDGDLIGELNGQLFAGVVGGSAYSSNDNASAFAQAYGVDGGVSNDFNGVVAMYAEGGEASSSNGYAHASGLLKAVDGDLGGNLSGSNELFVLGGSAVSATTNSSAGGTAYGVDGQVDGDLTGLLELDASGGYAESGGERAYASGRIIGVDGALLGDLSGRVEADAYGGEALGETNAYASGLATAIDGMVGGDLSGVVDLYAEGGYAIATNGIASASGVVVGVRGGVHGEMSGTLVGRAVGGFAESHNNARANANATGIYMTSGSVSNMTGRIDVWATSGRVMLNDETNVGDAFAYAVRATTNLYLNVDGGTLHASINAPFGYELSVTSGAYAVKGGIGSDIVYLKDADLIGDIDLESGTNLLVISGDTRIDGDIYATDIFGAAQRSHRALHGNDFRIMNGMLTPVGSMHVSDLRDNQLVIEGDGGLSFELYEDENSDLNSKLVVNGGVVASNGASLAAYAAPGQNADAMNGSWYEVITATNGFDGSFVQHIDSLFDLHIQMGDTNVMILLGGLQGQEGENTPACSSVAKTATASANAVMGDLSRHAGGMRASLRAPGGARGPESTDRQALEAGEWLVTVRQLNHLGSQDGEGGMAGYDWKSHGFMVGTEKLLNDGLLIGAAAGGVRTDLDGEQGAGGGASEMVVASLYANWFSDAWYAEAGLAYGHAWNDAQRIASDAQRYSGEFDSDLYAGWLEAGYTLSGETYQLEPYGRTTYVSGHHDGYTDAGGLNPLTVNDNTTDNWLVEFGARGGREWVLDNGDLIELELRAGLRSELLDTSVGANGSLLGTDVSLTSPESDAHALVLGVRTDWTLSERLQLGVEYEPLLSGNWYSHNISGTVRLQF